MRGFLILIAIAAAIYGYATNAPWTQAATVVLITLLSSLGDPKKKRPAAAKTPVRTLRSELPPPTSGTNRVQASDYEIAKQAELAAEQNRTYRSQYAPAATPHTLEAREFDFRSGPAPRLESTAAPAQSGGVLTDAGEGLTPEQFHALVMQQLGVATPAQVAQLGQRITATVTPAATVRAASVRTIDHGHIPRTTPAHDLQQKKTTDHLAQMSASLPRSTTPATLSQMQGWMPERLADPELLPSRRIARTPRRSQWLLLMRSRQRRMIQREMARSMSAGAKAFRGLSAPSAKVRSDGTMHAPKPFFPRTLNPLVRG